MNADDSGLDQRQSLAWATVTPKKHRRHTWEPRYDAVSGHYDVCQCGAIRDLLATRRGRNNRRRGNAIELEVAKQLGLTRVGMYGGPEDISGEAFVVQVKSGKSFPERLWTWLKALPANAGQTPLVVITDAPGPGHRRRALVVLTLEDWVALHGPLE